MTNNNKHTRGRGGGGGVGMSRCGRGSWADFKRCASSIKGDEARYKQRSQQMSLQQVAGEEAVGEEGQEGEEERDREKERERETVS